MVYSQLERVGAFDERTTYAAVKNLSVRKERPAFDDSFALLLSMLL